MQRFIYYLAISYLLCSFTSVIIGKLSRNEDKKLLFVSTVYRHADRSPVMLYPNDPNGMKPWPQGPGQLTQRGMRQEAALGNFFKKRYMADQKFLNATYIRDEVRIRSTNYDRTLMSAESQLSALYPPHGGQVWNKRLKWQPVPIHTVPKANDSLLLAFDLHCKRYTELQKKYQMSPEFLHFSRKYESFLKNVSKLAGYKKSLTVSNIYVLHDALFCEKEHNLTLPDWATNGVMDTLRIINDFSLASMFHGKECRKISAGELLYRIISDMKLVKARRKKAPTKFMMYSSHDTTELALLNALGISNGLQPPYASAVIIEFYVAKNSNYFVKILYRNSTNQPYILTIPGCKQECPLGDFIRLTASVTSSPGQFPQLCKGKSITDSVTHFNTLFIGVASAIAVASFTFGLLVACLVCSNGKHTRKGWRQSAPDYEYDRLNTI